MAMILHELYTNALKYGALATDGRIDLDWRTDGEDVVLIWRESGATRSEPPASDGFGHKMIAMTAKADLGGSVDFDWGEAELAVTIRFPLRS